MKTIKTTLPFIILVVFYHSPFAQSSKTGRYFDDPVITDSTSTMLIPYRYDAMLFSSNKMMTWNYYANFMVYDFKSDSYKKLFAQDTYIYDPSPDYYARQANAKPIYPYITGQWVFYLVRNTDYNNNRKIDDKDPQILFVSDRNGAGLRALTQSSESVAGLTLYESLGFALLTIRRDDNNDKEFDRVHDTNYIVRLSLSDLQLGKPIEMPPNHTN
jgi:hypothetical protein